MQDIEDIEKTEKFSVSVWKKIFRYITRKKSHLILLIVSAVFLAGLDILTPILNKTVIKVFFNENVAPDYGRMPEFVVYYVLIAIGYALAIYLYLNMAGKIEVDVADDIRCEAFSRLQELSFSYYDKNAAGWIMARLTSDSRKLSEIISWGLVDMVWGGATMVGILGILYVYSWKLSLILTIMAPIMLVVCMYFRKKILIAYRGVRRVNSKITGSYNEGILGSKTTKTLVLEGTKNQEFLEICGEMKKKSLHAILRSAILWPIVLIIGYMGVASILRVGTGFVFAGDMTPDTLYLFINFCILFIDPIMQISRTLAEFQQAQAAAERVLSLIETTPEIQDTDEVVEKYGTLFDWKTNNWEEIQGKVEFDHVTFKYIENEIILDDFSLLVEPGQSVALVGTTGSGKSTIVNLLCRFYEPVKGSIKIDGVDYKNRSIAWLHHNLGYVLQTPHLFNGTIKENIKYGKADATDEEVIAAAKAVNAHEFITSFDEGYETNVGEGGAKLSLGQRQLISFARALIINPRILILDEATSSIDTQTEYIIQDAINELLKGRTTFIVAHRLSTIINSDVILVIQKGKIVEKGSHKELLKLKGEYYNLYKNQFINEQLQESVNS